MSAKGHISRMTIDEEDHKKLKHLYSTHVPNAKTLEAIKQIQREENLVEGDNFDDLFRKLGI